ncbi:hypothetical protein DPMN_016597 [Dreissena polymorpha]|uniref:Caveolin n=1 Tax=Dreissena polymorpha TaxID=45954 RepID=A0A9D4NEW7_DREPO|nr:hypothetical protein DPMN_016597 [Dreissena polymorpha]
MATGAGSVDLINRDPNGINGHLQVAFEDVLGEPEGIRSIDCVWKMAFTCFECWKGLCYKLATLLCGCCIAACWGVDFATISFVPYLVLHTMPSLVQHRVRDVPEVLCRVHQLLLRTHVRPLGQMRRQSQDRLICGPYFSWNIFQLSNRI